MKQSLHLNEEFLFDSLKEHLKSKHNFDIDSEDVYVKFDGKYLTLKEHFVCSGGQTGKNSPSCKYGWQKH